MRDLGVGCVGTARFQRGWPPKEYKDINNDRFNTLYLLKEEHQLTARWIDNNVVTMVSTVHTGQESIKRHRRKPRPTATNKNHVNSVWGSKGTVEIEIPSIVDDYNHWMGGVDKADQLIAYYRPKLRCRRTWMPLLFHTLDCMRVNAFIVTRSYDRQITHKTFLQHWIKALLGRAYKASMQVRRASRHSGDYQPTPQLVLKRRRMSHKRPTLPEYRFNGIAEEHQHITDTTLTGKHVKPRACTYCAYEASMAKLLSMEPPAIKRTVKKCSYCFDYLCKDHFDDFHAKEDNSDPLSVSV